MAKPLGRRDYEGFARRYAERASTKPHNAYYERPATLSLLPDVAGRRVLDAGCGPGHYARELLAQGADVVAVDVTPEMVELAHAEVGDRAVVLEADLGQPLAFAADEDFDAASLSTACSSRSRPRTSGGPIPSGAAVLPAVVLYPVSDRWVCRHSQRRPGDRPAHRPTTDLIDGVAGWQGQVNEGKGILNPPSRTTRRTQMYTDAFRIRSKQNPASVASALAVCAVLVSPPSARGGSPAIVVDDAGDRAVVFDTGSNAVLGSVAVGSGAAGDCSIVGGLGFVTAFDSSVWVIDLSASPPALAAGTNPIPISNPGRDTALTPDGRYLLVCGGILPAPVSVVDVAARAEVDSFDPGHGCSAVEVCDDSTVLIAFYDFDTNFKIIRRLTIDAAGQLADTGTTFEPDDPENLTCAPGSATAVTFGLGGQAQSLGLPALTPLDIVDVFPGVAIAGQVSWRGDRLFVRASDGITGSVEGYDYDSATGAITDAPLFELPVSGPPGFFGGDRLGLDPTGSKLYVPEPGALEIYDAATGGFLGAITAPDIVAPTGVCVGTPLFADGFESGDTSAWSSQVP